MSVYSLNGVPGSGKTLLATKICLDHYKNENKISKYILSKILYKCPIKKIQKMSDYEWRKCFKNIKINNVYSNFPILLDKKNNIYSNRVSLWDLDNKYSFQPHSIIVIDEVQLYADSDEYKDKEINKKLRKVAKFLQAHRHFGIDTIIIISQHPSRIFKKARNIIEYYSKQRKMIQLPFGLNKICSITLMLSTEYFEEEFYGRFIPRSREEKKKLPFDYKKRCRLFFAKKIYKSYDSRYLSNYNYEQPLIDKGTYSSNKVDYVDLIPLFEE